VAERTYSWPTTQPRIMTRVIAVHPDGWLENRNNMLVGETTEWRRWHYLKRDNGPHSQAMERRTRAKELIDALKGDLALAPSRQAYYEHHRPRLLAYLEGSGRW
jgi:hypothetical protein